MTNNGLYVSVDKENGMKSKSISENKYEYPTVAAEKRLNWFSSLEVDGKYWRWVLSRVSMTDTLKFSVRFRQF